MTQNKKLKTNDSFEASSKDQKGTESCKTGGRDRLPGLNEEERPYEKFVKKGAYALSDAELLAIILRTGVRGEDVLALSRRILKLSGNDQDNGQGLLGLTAMSYEELLQIRGVGHVKAVQIQCIAELSRRISGMRKLQTLKFNCPSSVADYYMEYLRHEERENLILIMLDGKNNLIRDMILSKGTVNCTPASPREIFKEALRANAVSVILVHNHPSGDPTPSQEDINVTKQISEAGEIIGIRLLDHIVIGDGIYQSLISQ